MAVLLQNRKANYVARKKTGAASMGLLKCCSLIKGVEFDGEFIGWLEAHGIHSRYTGAQAGWQHGFAEPHGGQLQATG